MGYTQKNRKRQETEERIKLTGPFWPSLNGWSSVGTFFSSVKQISIILAFFYKNGHNFYIWCQNQTKKELMES